MYQLSDKEEGDALVIDERPETSSTDVQQERTDSQPAEKTPAANPPKPKKKPTKESTTNEPTQHRVNVGSSKPRNTSAERGIGEPEIIQGDVQQCEESPPNQKSHKKTVPRRGPPCTQR